jgi:hypothetical protein
MPTHFKATWIQSKTICNAYGMKFISLDSPAESTYFFSYYEQNLALVDLFVHLGAIARVERNPTEWYWAETNQKVNFTLKWAGGEPSGYTHMCMTMMKYLQSYVLYDIPCSESNVAQFFCHTVER